MSVLHVLLPALTRSGAAQDFVHWLGKGDRLSDLPDPRASVTRELFRFDGEGIPVAALRHHAHGGDARNGIWMCADPAYAQSEATGARLMAWPLADIPDEEARALAAALAPLFADAGFELVVDTSSGWCVNLGPEAPNVEFTRPVDALGANLLDCLPQGDSGRPWRRLFNEAQIALHAHPVNAGRIAAGMFPVNALWFWGVGGLPAPESRLTFLASRDDVLRGLAMLAGVASVDPLPEALQNRGAAGDVLLDLDGRQQDEGLSGWLTHFQRALRDHRFDAIELLFPGGERFRVRRAHRLRFWRRG